MLKKLIITIADLILLATILSCIPQKKETNDLKIENIAKEENKTNEADQQQIQEEQNLDIYKSYEDYTNSLKNNKKIGEDLSKIYTHKNNVIKQDLKIAVLFLNDTNNDTEYTNKSLQLTNALFLSDLANDNVAIMPIFTDSSPLSIKKAILQAVKNNANVVISTLPSSLSKTASMEFEKDNKNTLFISLPYLSTKDASDAENILSFGLNPSDQINTIVQFAKYNSIKNISFVLPSNRFGGDLSLMFNNALQEFDDVSIENAEFFTNTTKLSTIKINNNDDNQKSVSSKNQQDDIHDAQNNFNIQRENGDDSNNIDTNIKDTVTKSGIKTNIHFYVNKILYFHYQKLEAINEFVANFGKNTQLNTISSGDKKSKNDEPKWKTPEEAIADKSLALFFTGSVAEKEQFMKIINIYKNKPMYKEVFKNLILLTDSTLGELIENSPQKFSNDFTYYKDIFTPYQSFNEMNNYNLYFEKKFQEKPTKLSCMLYDALSFANYIYAESDDFSNINKIIAKSSHKSMQGILGEFVVKNSSVKRNYRFIYVDKNGDIFKI